MRVTITRGNPRRARVLEWMWENQGFKEVTKSRVRKVPKRTVSMEVGMAVIGELFTLVKTVPFSDRSEIRK